MKLYRLLFILAFGLVSFAAQAQRATLMPLILGDTIANTGTVTKTLPALTTGYAGLMIQTNLTKISGTGAGTAQLQISLDNTNWINSGSAFTITNVASQSTTFSLTYPIPVYARVLFTGSGSESVQVRMYYIVRKFSTSLN